jgi:hypothetical protein
MLSLPMIFGSMVTIVAQHLHLRLRYISSIRDLHLQLNHIHPKRAIPKANIPRPSISNMALRLHYTLTISHRALSLT